MIADINNLDAPQTAWDKGEAEPKPCQPVKVWLVDDDKPISRLLKELLETNTPLKCPRSFESPQAVLEALARQPAPDVILLDIQIGSANGLEAIHPIRLLAPKTRILMFTTFYDGLSEAQALEAGAVGFIVKSRGLEEIVQGIYQGLDKPLPAPVIADRSLTSHHTRKEVKRAPIQLEGAPAGQVAGGGLFRGLRDLVFGRAQAQRIISGVL